MMFFGLFILVLGLMVLVPSLGLLGQAYKTTGTVLEINSYTESGVSYQSPLVEFTTVDGQQINVDMYYCVPFECFADYTIGSKVSLIYPSNLPEFAIADTLSGRLWTPLFIMIIGLVITLIGSVYLAIVISDWRDRSTQTDFLKSRLPR